MADGAAIVLCGGKSSRMGYDKQLLKVGGKPMAVHVADELSAVFGDVVLVSNTPDLYSAYDYRVVEDELKDFGPLGGFHAGLKAVDAPWAYITACDMPFIEKAYCRWLAGVHLAAKAQITVVRDEAGRFEPFGAIYSKEALPYIEQAYKMEQGKVIGLYNRLKTVFVDRSALPREMDGAKIFANLNQPKDVKKWQFTQTS